MEITVCTIVWNCKGICFILWTNSSTDLNSFLWLLYILRHFGDLSLYCTTWTWFLGYISLIGFGTLNYLPQILLLSLSNALFHLSLVHKIVKLKIFLLLSLSACSVFSRSRLLSLSACSVFSRSRLLSLSACSVFSRSWLLSLSVCSVFSRSRLLSLSVCLVFSRSQLMSLSACSVFSRSRLLSLSAC